jgi:hypothetical protein
LKLKGKTAHHSTAHLVAQHGKRCKTRCYGKWLRRWLSGGDDAQCRQPGALGVSLMAAAEVAGVAGTTLVTGQSMLGGAGHTHLHGAISHGAADSRPCEIGVLSLRRPRIADAQAMDTSPARAWRSPATSQSSTRHTARAMPATRRRMPAADPAAAATLHGRWLAAWSLPPPK